MKPARSIWWISLTALVASCGGGGGGGGGGSVSAPSDLVYPTPPPLVLNQPMTAVTPTVTGQVTSYSISPALPPGLSLNAATGTISGTPTAAANSASYTVTAKNSVGSTSGVLSLQVVSSYYASSYYQFTPGVTAQNIWPVVSGLTSWGVSPALPSGLTFDTTNGKISGTPAATTAAANYTITATAAAGQVTTTLTIAVTGTTLLNLGPTAAINQIRYVGNSVLTEDNSYEWVLLNYTTAAMLASGPGGASGAYVDLESDVMVDQTGTGLQIEVRSGTTGQLQATIQSPTQPVWIRLATDGSYVAVGTQTALTVWSSTGQLLFSQAGDYSGAAPSAAPGQMLIANGPAGANVIQTLTVPGDVASVSPAFQGTFNSWFADGQHFLSNLGSSVWVYTSTAALVQFFSPGSGILGGSGNWYWDYNGNSGVLDVYPVTSTTPALTLNVGCCVTSLTPSGSTLGVLNNVGELTVIDLSGGMPGATNYSNLPFGAGYAYGALSASQWLSGGANGTILDGASLGGTPRSLTLGAAFSIVAGTSYFSVATAVGKIFVFNSSDDSLAATIDFPAGQLAASADGTVLAAATGGTVNIYSLPAGTVSESFSYPGTGGFSITMSATGNALGELFNGPTAAGCLAQVITLPAGATILCDNTTAPQVANIQLSPDGTLFADGDKPPENGATPLTNVYKNGTLITTLPGYAAGWLSNSELLVDNYTLLGSDIGSSATGTTIYDASGNLVGTTPLINMQSFQLVPGATGSIYCIAPSSIPENSIVSVSSWATTWASGDPGRKGAVTASQVVFEANNQVLAQPY
jgi:hypothetical protein